VHRTQKPAGGVGGRNIQQGPCTWISIVYLVRYTIPMYMDTVCDERHQRGQVTVGSLAGSYVRSRVVVYFFCRVERGARPLT